MKLFLLWFVLANGEHRSRPADINLCNQTGEEFAIAAEKNQPYTVDGIPVQEGGCVVYLQTDNDCEEGAGA